MSSGRSIAVAIDPRATHNEVTVMQSPERCLSAQERVILSALKQINRAGSPIDIEIETRMIGKTEKIEEILESLSTSGLLEIHPSSFGKLYVLTRRGYKALHNFVGSSEDPFPSPDLIY